MRGFPARAPLEDCAGAPSQFLNPLSSIFHFWLPNCKLLVCNLLHRPITHYIWFTLQVSNNSVSVLQMRNYNSTSISMFLRCSRKNTQKNGMLCSSKPMRVGPAANKKPVAAVQ